MSSVVLQTAFLGDMILTTPLLTRLAERGPVDVVATPASAGLLENHPAVRAVIVYDKRGADSGIGGLRRLAARVRNTGARTAYLAQGSLRTATLAQLAGIGERIGFATSPGRVLYTRRVPFRRDLHHAERLWTLASSSPIDAVPAGITPSLFPGEVERAAVRDLLKVHGVADSQRIIALAPGSVWLTKRWPSYHALAQRLVESKAFRETRVVVIGAAADAPLAAAVSDALVTMGAPPAIDATGKLSLLSSAALIARAVVLVTNDSAPLHLASAMNTPTVAIFGPTVPEFGFGPLAESRRVLGHVGLTCRPCDAHGPTQCPLGHWRCMRELDAEQVLMAVGEVAKDRA